MQATNRIRNILAALVVLMAAAALIGATVWTPSRDTERAAPAKVDGPAPMVGTFTGEFDRGVPVYRLPPVTITTTRSAELARMAQEEQLARK
jgi:hypothetical protein